MIRVKIDIVAALKDAGYNPWKINVENLFGNSTMTKFRRGGLPSWNELNKICKMTGLDIPDMVEYVPDEDGSL